MPCDVLQPRLPLAGFAIVAGLVLLARVVKGRRRMSLEGTLAVALLAVALLVAGVALLVTNGTVGCAVEGLGPAGAVDGRSVPAQGAT